MNVAARTLLEESRSRGDVETWVILLAQFPPKHHAAVSAAAAVGLLASGAKVPRAVLRSGQRVTSQMCFGNIVSSSAALSDSDNDGQHFVHV